MKKVVVDTNVYISALFWGGKPRQVIDLARDSKILIYTSEDIEREILDKLVTKFGINISEASSIMTDFSTFTKLGKISHRVHVVEDDDDKFIECALECGAECIISGDKHLLRLINYKGIEILNAASFLGKEF